MSTLNVIRRSLSKVLTFAMVLALIAAVFGSSIAFAQSSEIEWGPAGEAPQSAAEAARLLGINAEDAIYLTDINPQPGDPTAIGWVLGTNASGDAGIQVEALTIPSGTCLDYDPGVTKLTASHTAGWPVNFLATWQRTMINSVAHYIGLKITIYWTECDTDVPGMTPKDGTAPKAVPGESPRVTVQPTVQPDEPTTTVSGMCPASPADAAKMIGGVAGNWKEHEGSNKTGWIYNGPEITFKQPEIGRLDFDGGEIFAGQPVTELPEGVVATLWCEVDNPYADEATDKTVPPADTDDNKTADTSTLSCAKYGADHELVTFTIGGKNWAVCLPAELLLEIDKIAVPATP